MPIKTKPSRRAPSPHSVEIGHAYVFFRDDHKWHGCEVSVISIKGDKITVARSSAVAEGFLAPKGSKKRKLETWACTSPELW
ncbi:MAG: hypothetical protein K0R17_3605 [Rariglobus sp.]|jgi:hypothetical protein|nr:hypothetical protein [Rariglobus sp.]